MSREDLFREFAKLESKVIARPALRTIDTVSALAVEMWKNDYDHLDLPNLLKVVDWLLAIPLSNAGK